MLNYQVMMEVETGISRLEFASTYFAYQTNSTKLIDNYNVALAIVLFWMQSLCIEWVINKWFINKLDIFRKKDCA